MKLIKKDVKKAVDLYGMLVAVSVGMASTFLVSIVGAICINSEYMHIDRGNMVSTISWVIGAFGVGFLGCRSDKENRILGGILATGIYFSLLLLTGILLMGGIASSIWRGIMSCGIGAASGILLCRSTFRKAKRRKWRMKNR